MRKLRIYIGLGLCACQIIFAVWIVSLGVKVKRIDRERAATADTVYYQTYAIRVLWSKADSTEKHLAFYDDLMFPVEDQLTQAMRDSMEVWMARFKAEARQ